MRFSKTAASLAALTLGGALTAIAAPATADLVTICRGAAGPVTVPNDLRVPRNASCELNGTTVQGDVRVARGANLILTDATLEGTARVVANGYLDAVNTTIDGRVILRNAYGVYLETSEVETVRQSAAEDTELQSFVFTDRTTVDGRIASLTGSTVVDSSTVTGRVIGRNGLYTDFYNSVVEGRLVINGNSSGSVVCESEIYGNGRFVNNAVGLQVGATGPLSLCDGGANYWDRNLTIANNAGEIVVSNNIIRGDLAGTGNDPAPTGSDNRVRGEVSGQFVDLPPAASARTFSKAPDHRAQLENRAEQRREAGTAEAKRSPNALR